MGPRAGLDGRFEVRKISNPCRKLKQRTSVVQPVASSLSRLRHAVSMHELYNYSLVTYATFYEQLGKRTFYSTVITESIFRASY